MVSEKTVSLEVAIEVVLRNGPTFETIAGLCKMAVDAERDKSFRAGFYAGFSYSGEGWNGEYPFQDKNRPIIGDQLVEAALTAALAERNQS